ncbi:hypothetical protein [Flavobacterium sp. 102]|uniref:hypothetical protein n=1 Tax=Flavobacterium sp. 102 TaxID=2135623 RepID=UPI000EB289F2|nr:hypothetical protein [Flavobacterium sp. 102]RKS01678.1 hypothetical protein C8C84_1355 [Flavobacterium sp. 102]
MNTKINHLPEPLRQLAEKHFVLLESQNIKKKRDTIQLNLSGYSDVMFLIADIVKVCILALEGDTSCNRIPEPTTNISGVLGIILDLVPYEEADLLDHIREAVLQPSNEKTEEREDYILENIFLTLPISFQN